MLEAALDRHVLAVGLHQLPGRQQVHDNAYERDDQYRPATHGRWRYQPANRLVDDQRGEDEQRPPLACADRISVRLRP